MTQIATTIEQSKRILEAAGSKVKSFSDCYYPYLCDRPRPYEDAYQEKFIWENLDLHTPAWSLSALWAIVNGMDKVFTIDTNRTLDQVIEIFVGIIVNEVRG